MEVSKLEVVEVSQLGCLGSRNQLQKQKKGPWNLGERKAKVTPLGGRRGRRERCGHIPERERALELRYF